MQVALDARILSWVDWSQRRLLIVAGAAAASLAAAGLAAEAWRFGLTSGAAATRLERDVRDRFARRAQDVEGLARRVATETARAVDAAAERPDAVPALFDQLNLLDPAPASSANSTTVTVYVRRPDGQYRILAWSDGPAESISTQDLGGDATLLLVPGTLGLRLVSVQPIEFNGRRVAAAAAETVLAPRFTGTLAGDALPGAASGLYRFDTRYGPVTISFPGSGDVARQPDRFAVTTPGRSGFDVQISSLDLPRARSVFRRRALALSALPLVAVMFLLTAGLVARRKVVGAVTLVFGGALALVLLARAVGAPASVEMNVIGFSGLALVALLPGSFWWHGLRRRRVSRAPLRFALEQAAAGIGMAGCAWLIAELLSRAITPATLPQWQRPLFPLRVDAMASLAGVFAVELALFWAAATLLALMAARWRLRTRQWRVTSVVCALWFVPAIVLIVYAGRVRGIPDFAWLPVAILAVLFGVGARRLRNRYRRTTQALRLVLLYVALAAPILVLYPVAWFYADKTAREIVAEDYAVRTARRLNETIDVLRRAQSEIDRLPASGVVPLLSPTTDSGVSTLPAFNIWNQTSLSATRLTSAVELYNQTGTLVSRFALNMPEYRSTPPDTAIGRPITAACDAAWQVFGEVVPFGAEERDVVHASRPVCDTGNRPLGAVAVHVMNDYSALPFVATPDPYSDVLSAPDAAPRGSILPDLQVVVYGWSYAPIFTSGNVAWPITPDVDARLYASRQPFWTTVDAEGRNYEVYFSNNSSYVYALGFPSPTWFEHVTRLAEASALMAMIFVVWLLGAAAYVPLARRASAPLRVLLEEIRTNFYRKLFLLFVLAAVAPVLIFALAFGVYMTAKLRADVETEAATVVTVARRVLEQASAFEPQPGPFNDDVMVYVGQVLHQDVNLFEGPELLATSQRDLYASGLLPTRTPAKVYRAIALNRLPSFVAEEWLGPFSYLVAAAPMPAAGRQQLVLSIPLASRQREIEREIDELNRGVLVGAVFVVLFAAALGASVAGRISDPVKRLSDATRLIADDKLDVRLVAETSDELSRLIDDFNTMAERLRANRAELARANQLEAWAEMARQVAHEIKNPLTPIQLATEHLDHVHTDRGRPLGAAFEQCVTTILRQVRLLRQIASEFSTFAGQPTPRLAAVPLPEVLEEIVQPYRIGLRADCTIDLQVPAELPRVWADRTLIARALTNLMENALQAMPGGGVLRIATDTDESDESTVAVTFTDTGVGMDAEAAARAFEPYFSTKTGGSGLGLANARRNIEICGGSIVLTSAPGQGTSVRVTLLRHDRHDVPGSGSTPGR
jgi:signal transduction histidine kinase